MAEKKVKIVLISWIDYSSSVINPEWPMFLIGYFQSM